MEKKTVYKTYNSIDVLKLILAILVLVIHAGIDKTVISPVLRIAVPLFFIISGYFFFLKQQTLHTKAEKNRALWLLVKRNGLLYIFWSVAQLPVTMYARDYLEVLPKGLWYALRDILLGSGFTGAWYIPALVVGVVIVFYLSKKLSNAWLAALTLPIYGVCCLLTNYGNLFDAGGIITGIGEGYRELTGGQYFYTSFPAALFWVSAGKLLAEQKRNIRTGMMWAAAAIATALIMIERYTVVRWSLAITDDCYFSLMLLCPVVFWLVKENNTTFSGRFRFREMSTLLYVTHGACGRIVGAALKLKMLAALNNEIIKAIVTLLVAMAVSKIFLWIRDRFPKIKVLKYAC